MALDQHKRQMKLHPLIYILRQQTSNNYKYRNSDGVRSAERERSESIRTTDGMNKQRTSTLTQQNNAVEVHAVYFNLGSIVRRADLNYSLIRAGRKVTVNSPLLECLLQFL